MSNNIEINIPSKRLLLGVKTGKHTEGIRKLCNVGILQPSRDLIHLLQMQDYLCEMLDYGGEVEDAKV